MRTAEAFDLLPKLILVVDLHQLNSVDEYHALPERCSELLVFFQTEADIALE